MWVIHLLKVLRVKHTGPIGPNWIAGVRVYIGADRFDVWVYTRSKGQIVPLNQTDSQQKKIK